MCYTQYRMSQVLSDNSFSFSYIKEKEDWDNEDDEEE